MPLPKTAFALLISLAGLAPASGFADGRFIFKWDSGVNHVVLACPVNPKDTGTSRRSKDGFPYVCDGIATQKTFMIVYNDGFEEQGDMPPPGQGAGGMTGCVFTGDSNDPKHGGIAKIWGCSPEAQSFANGFAPAPAAQANSTYDAQNAKYFRSDTAPSDSSSPVGNANSGGAIVVAPPIPLTGA